MKAKAKTKAQHVRACDATYVAAEDIALQHGLTEIVAALAEYADAQDGDYHGRAARHLLEAAQILYAGRKAKFSGRGVQKIPD